MLRPLIDDGECRKHGGRTVARDHLAQLAELLPDERNVTFVGDCKLVDKTTVGRLMRADPHFVSLVPKAYNLRGELVEKARAKVPMLTDCPVLVTKAGRRNGDAKRAYRGMTFEAPFRAMLEDAAGDGPESEESLRFLVVASDVLADKIDRSREAKPQREATALNKRVRTANHTGSACEVDAHKAAKTAVNKAKLHTTTNHASSTQRR